MRTPRATTGSTAVDVPEHPEGTSFNPNQIKDIKSADPASGVTLIEAPSASNTGDARLTYPLTVPPGRAGMVPDLALRYSSAGGNGWLGTGWDLTTPSVTLDTRWGVPRYDGGLETETYVLNGEQLTPVAHRSAPQARTSEKVFHTRVEGKFSKIVRHGDAPANYWWEVTDKTGTRMIFGNAEGATLADARGNIATWALREIRDANDNFVRYHHVRVEDGGVDGATVAGSNLYVDRITYTGHGSTEGRYSVHFDRDRERGEARRGDVGIDARNGFKKVTADLLRRVEVKLDDELIRAYELNYRTGAFHKSLLASVTQFAADNRAFNTHSFDYFDDIRDTSGAYDAFSGSTGWSVPDDDLGVNIRDGEAGALSSNTSKGAGGHLYVGYSPTGPSKSNSAGVKVGYNAGSSEGLLALADVNGDNLPDKVFRDGGAVYYRPNLSGPNGQSRFGDTPIRLDGLPGIAREKTRSTTVGIESYFGVAAQLDHVSTTTTSDRYLTDVNGDGITDLVNNGGVLFGRVDASGNPVYGANSQDTGVPIGPGAVSGTIVGDQTAEFERAVDASPLLDGVRRWVAPYDGNVKIDGRVRLVQDTSPERAEHRTADGVRVTIQHEDTELWAQRIGPNDYFEFAPTGVNSIPVQKGDAIYFRVQSILDGLYDQVAWDPEITYVGMSASTDVNLLPNNRYLASRDFTLGGRPSQVTAPLTGTLHLSGDAVKSAATTDDVTVVVSRNGTDVYSHTLAAGSAGTAAIDLDIPVTAQDTLSWRLKVDSPIDAGALSWVPKAHYTAAQGVDAVVDDAGNPTIVISAPYDLDMYPATTLTAPQGSYTATTEGDISVQPNLAFAGLTTSAKVVFTVKKRGALVAKRTIDIVNGAVPPLAPVTVAVQPGDELFFDYSTLDTTLLGKLSAQSVTVDGVDAPSALHASVEQGAFAQPYRGWGAIGYQGNRERATQPIHQNELVLDENYKNNLPDGPTEADLPGFENDPTVNAPKIVVFAPMPAQGRWAGADENTWVTAAGTSSSRLGGDVIDVATDADFAGATGVSRRGKTKQLSTTLGVGPVGGSLAKGKSKGEVDFLDLNGDRFPDAVGSGGVQYSDMIGGLGSTRGSVGGDVRESETKAFSVSAGAGSPARTSSSARGQDAPTGGTAANTAKSGLEMPGLGIGGNLGGGESDTGYDLLDINGDALPDKVFENGDAALNLGYSFATREPWRGGPVNAGDTTNAGVNLGFNTNYYGFAGGVSASTGSSKTDATIVDVNGDGLADRVFNGNGGPIAVAINTGSGFAAPTPFRGSHNGVNTDKNATLGGGVYFTFGFCFIFGCIVFNPGADVSTGIGRTELALRDVDGDGFADHVKSGRDSELQVAHNRTGRTNMLKSVARPLGARIDVDYTRAGNTTAMPESRWVMSRTTVFDGHPGDGQDLQVSTYRYENGRYDRLEREFYGFAKVVTEQRDAGAGDALYRSQTQEYRVDGYYTRGLLVRGATTDAQGRLFSETVNTYRLRDVATGAEAPGDSATATVFPELARTEERFYEGQAAPGKTTAKEMAYDEYGNLVRTLSLADAGTADDLETRLGYSAATPACRASHIVGVANTMEERGSTGVLRRRESTVDCTTGDVTQVREQVADGQVAVTDMEFRADGNLKSITKPTTKSGQRYKLDYEYDGVVGVHVEAVTDSFGYRSTTTHELKYGLPTTVTDENGQRMVTAYDSVGRVDSITGPYELPENRFTIDFEYHPEATVPYAVTRHVDRAADGVRADTIDTIQFADGLKRLVQTKKDSTVAAAAEQNPAEVMTVSGRTVYDFAGRSVEQYYPLTEPKGSGNTTFNPSYDSVAPNRVTFDVLDRQVRTVAPDGVVSSVAYGFGADRGGVTRFESVTTDGNGKQRRTYVDVRSLTTSVKEFNPAGGQPVIWTSYGYDALGQLLTVVDDKNNTTSTAYDLMGRRTIVDNPDSGRVETRYDLASNITAKVTSKLRAAGKAVEYDYEFNRLKAIRYPTFTGNNVTYTYGAPGAADNGANRITGVKDGAGTVSRAYGPLGEVVRENRTVPESVLNGPARTYTTSYQFDSFNRVLRMTYPDGEVLTYRYDTGGLVDHAAGSKGGFDYTYLARLDYDKFGQRVLMETGTGVRTTYNYDAADRQLAVLKSRLPDGHQFQNISYTYDNVNNIKQLRNDVALPHAKPIGGPSTQTYTYDDLYRLTAATGEYRYADNKLDRYSMAVGYDSIHNTTRKTQTHDIVVSQSAAQFQTVAYEEPTTVVEDPVHDPTLYPPLGVIEEPEEEATSLEPAPDPGTDPIFDPPLSTESAKSESFGTQAAASGTNVQPQRKTTYDYGYNYTAARPHAPTAVGPVNQVYDANGNLIDTVNTLPPAPGKRRQMVWDEENRLACNQDHARNRTVEQAPAECVSPQQPATVRYYYDDHGARVVKIAGPQHIYPNRSFSERNGTGFKHVFVGETRLATKTVKPDSTYENHIFYFHNDHLGSSGYVTDEHSNLTEHLEYFAFGETWVNEHPAQPTPVPYQYGSKELDEETGLYYYGARYYNPRTNVWQSPDPILAQYLEGQPNGGVFQPFNLSPYAYANQNPIRMGDPDGRAPSTFNRIMGGVKLVGGVLEAAAGATLATTTGVTGIGAVAGVAVAVHGSDVAVTGWKQMWSGEDESSGTSKLMQAAGVSKGTADTIDAGLSIAGGGGARIAAGRLASGGPGAWGLANEAMSARAAAYQVQITGRAAGSVYRVGGVKFDGFVRGVLQEAKGPGYANFVKNGQFQSWWKGADGLVAQAQRQLAAAGKTPIQWSVAEASAAQAITRLFASRGITGIRVVHVPSL
ncbi:SpvB/TcaC N-terminal domain-containing protein [Actinokineospora sp. HUAS TT18]|uniref:SpvB/TcaC N-terminal domain-containing protein n=1 Tax=Actinokineospora sp. HUAS TT18 TaxID=3447451 RepID=UPI003F52411B